MLYKYGFMLTFYLCVFLWLTAEKVEEEYDDDDEEEEEEEEMEEAMMMHDQLTAFLQQMESQYHK